MKITGETTILAVLEIDEEKMMNTLTWLAPELGRLQYPNPRRSVVGRVSVEQASRIARVPLAEMLYVLNLAAGESEENLSKELNSGDLHAYKRHHINPEVRVKSVAR